MSSYKNNNVEGNETSNDGTSEDQDKTTHRSDETPDINDEALAQKEEQSPAAGTEHTATNEVRQSSTRNDNTQIKAKRGGIYRCGGGMCNRRVAVENDTCKKCENKIKKKSRGSTTNNTVQNETNLNKYSAATANCSISLDDASTTLGLTEALSHAGDNGKPDRCLNSKNPIGSNQGARPKTSSLNSKNPIGSNQGARPKTSSLRSKAASSINKENYPRHKTVTETVNEKEHTTSVRVYDASQRESKPKIINHVSSEGQCKSELTDYNNHEYVNECDIQTSFDATDFLLDVKPVSETRNEISQSEENGHHSAAALALNTGVSIGLVVERRPERHVANMHRQNPNQIGNQADYLPSTLLDGPITMQTYEDSVLELLPQNLPDPAVFEITSIDFYD